MASYWEIKNQKKFPIDSWNQFCKIRKRIFHYLRSVIWKLKSEIRLKSETRNPKAEIRNQTPEIRKQKSGIRSQEPETRNPKSEIRNQKSSLMVLTCSRVRLALNVKLCCTEHFRVTSLRFRDVDSPMMACPINPSASMHDKENCDWFPALSLHKPLSL